MLRNDLIERWLREGRFVALVVAVAAIADKIDQKVEFEAMPVRPRQASRFDAGNRIVGVDMHDRDLEPARQSARVTGAVRLFWRGGETEQIVGDDVNHPADLITVETGEI